MAVSISQYHLNHPQGRVDRLAFIKCDENSFNPKGVLESAVSDYVANEGYNEFVEIELDNPWLRVILKDINELYYQRNILPDYLDVEIFDQQLIGRNGEIGARVSVLRGGLTSARPITYMNDAVLAYAGMEEYKQFIEIFLDNPWVRVLIFPINELQYEPFTNQRINGEL